MHQAMLHTHISLEYADTNGFHPASSTSSSLTPLSQLSHSCVHSSLHTSSFSLPSHTPQMFLDASASLTGAPLSCEHPHPSLSPSSLFVRLFFIRWRSIAFVWMLVIIYDISPHHSVLLLRLSLQKWWWCRKSIWW